MKNFKIIYEAAYNGNIGFSEMAKFWQVASKSQIKKMEQIIIDEDWEGFKMMIQEVLNVKLK